MNTQVILLGELAVLVYGDFAATYQKTGNLFTTLSLVPRAMFGAALVWAMLYFLSDIGAGTFAAFVGFVIAGSFVLADYGLLTGTLGEWITKFTNMPIPTAPSSAPPPPSSGLHYNPPTPIPGLP